MTITLAEVAEKTAVYLAAKWQCQVDVTNIMKIFGGASRETYRLEVVADGNSRGLILRRDPPTSLIDTERELEYGAYAAIYPTDIPVPEPLFLENDTSIMQQPFSIMAAVDGAVTDVTTLNEEQKGLIGREKWQLLGSLAMKDPIGLGFDEFMEVPELDQCAAKQLAYWEKVILEDEIHPQSIAHAAIRWLKNNLPPPAQKLSVVHGDYRSGNFLFDPAAGIKAVLDWEMCHLGDPLEDLAWSLDPLWSWAEPENAGGLLPPGEAIRLWEESSGLALDPGVFKWWRVFASLKGLAIWISSSEDFQNGEGKDSILAMAGWLMTDRQNQILLNYLSPHSVGEWKGGIT
ncbi:MAG: phosphotransferase family protein [Gammaproteobacteria bacterium]|jgi:aminoglycoside phosphotransferase (APT) family kinase protein|nr:phosphotransferase family protein [Gammaproteobacteria bacterium]|tara:strand:+ start:1345 stop:2382 length:1038 start_codon:yes stop_codon:yes gene_type:complete